MLKRTSASLFLNTYVTREDALYLNLAIRKAALGLEIASDSAQEAAGALADIDWDEVLGGVSVPGRDSAWPYEMPNGTRSASTTKSTARRVQT